jgi:hypothetical protein
MALLPNDPMRDHFERRHRDYRETWINLGVVALFLVGYYVLILKGALTSNSAFSLAVVFVVVVFAIRAFGAATAWLAEARERGGKALPIYTLADAAAEVRWSKSDTAGKALEEHWRELSSTLAGNILHPLAAVRAFAASRQGVREAGRAGRLLDPLRQVADDELALFVEWPEMTAFLSSNGLARA